MEAMFRGGSVVHVASPHLLVADFVHELKALQWLFDHHSDVLLRQWAGAVGVVKVKEALVGGHPQEGCHVLKVGQRGGEANKADHLLRRLWWGTFVSTRRIHHVAENNIMRFSNAYNGEKGTAQKRHTTIIASRNC